MSTQGNAITQRKKNEIMNFMCEWMELKNKNTECGSIGYKIIHVLP